MRLRVYRSKVKSPVIKRILEEPVVVDSYCTLQEDAVNLIRSELVRVPLSNYHLVKGTCSPCEVIVSAQTQKQHERYKVCRRKS